MSLPSDSTTSNDGDEMALGSPGHPADAILRRVTEAFQLLTHLHGDLSRPDVPREAREHLAAATRELASIQRMFERRGNR